MNWSLLPNSIYEVIWVLYKEKGVELVKSISRLAQWIKIIFWLIYCLGLSLIITLKEVYCSDRITPLFTLITNFNRPSLDFLLVHNFCTLFVHIFSIRVKSVHVNFMTHRGLDFSSATSFTLYNTHYTLWIKFGGSIDTPLMAIFTWP